VFWKLFTRKSQLTGAPSSRRIKTYAAQSGYVYEYFYRGHRKQRREGEEHVEYVFAASAGRERPLSLSVFLPDSAVASWESANNRLLSATEKYALAKLALFRSFDERPSPAHMTTGLTIHLAEVEAFASTLGL
jgi:hypothetical protein